MADALRDHIAACPKHPMSVITAERDAERARADALAARCLELKGKLAEVGNERDGLRR